MPPPQSTGQRAPDDDEFAREILRKLEQFNATHAAAAVRPGEPASGGAAL
jgi:hypothetical protein